MHLAKLTFFSLLLTFSRMRGDLRKSLHHFVASGRKKYRKVLMIVVHQGILLYQNQPYDQVVKDPQAH